MGGAKQTLLHSPASLAGHLPPQLGTSVDINAAIMFMCGYGLAKEELYEHVFH